MNYDIEMVREKRPHGGYIALMATIIISMILLVMTVQEGSAGWYARFNILGTEAKEQANALAEGCADQALAAIITDPSYGSTETTVTTSGGTCTIFPIEFNTPTAGLVTIKTQAEVRGSYANLQIAMNMNEIHLGTPTAGKGTLFVVTQVINSGPGSADPDDFTMRVNATNPSPAVFPGSSTGVAVIMEAGSYDLTEEVPSGLEYAQTVSPTNCDHGSIGIGQVKTCTVTNTYVNTTLTLSASVTNDDLTGSKQPSDVVLSIVGIGTVALGVPIQVPPGTYQVSAVNPDPVHYFDSPPWGYQCANDGSVTLLSGQNKTCIINFDDIPPPTLACAETVIMLDRSGSMFPAYGGGANDIPNEKIAAKSLIDLYSGVTPNPQIGVGRFGDVATGQSAEVFSLLSTAYSAMKTAIDNGLPQSPLSYTNLADAISKSADELNSVRHVAGKERVIILVSDGDPNRPTGTTAFNTGFLAPSAEVQNGSGDLWSGASGAYTNGGTDTSDPVSEADRHRFYNFGFGNGAGLPAGSTVTGIEARADAWATAVTIATPANSAKSPTSSSVPNQWTSPNNAFSSNDSYATDSTNGHQQGYGNFGFSIPANATITGVQVTTEARAGASVTTLLSDGFGTGNPTDVPNWNENGSDTVVLAAGSGNDSASPNGSSFARIDDNGGWICRAVNASGLTNLTLSYNWRGDSDAENFNPSGSDGGPDLGVVEYNTNGSDCNTGSGWNTIESHDLSNDNSWSSHSETLPAVLNNDSSWLIRFRDPSVNGSGNPEYFRVDGVLITNTPPPVTGSLGVALSSNNGGAWTIVTRSTAIDGTESVDSPSGNGASDMWSRSWVPSDFNNGSFVLRVQNNSTTGIAVSLDQVIVTVFYTTPVSSGTSCQLGVDLSWNGGTNWSNEKTQTITGTEATYSLGASNDDWTSSHTWVSGDFSNTNFRARVRAIDPGSACDSTAVDHLDWLQLNVHYTQSTDPVQAALNAADAAKLAEVNLFTIHFGSDPSGYPGKELLANLANGSVAVSGHQDGSLSDGVGGGLTTTALISPTAQTADTGGDGNGFESNPNNALTDGSGNASNINGTGDRHRFSGYNFNLPPGAVINGIATRLDWWLDSTSGTNSMGVELSWNGGTSWTAAKTDGNDSTSSSNTRTLGSSSDGWGRTWTAAELDSGNFRVRLTSNSTSSSRDFYLDWIPVQVSYTIANTENSDDDNFFVAPTSADMDGIFDFIGEQVCPAALNLTAAAPPTTGSLIVMRSVTNNNGGSLYLDSFPVTVNASSPSQSQITGGAGDTSDTTTITVNAGPYSLTEAPVNNYNEIIGATCSSITAGDIVAGETRVCVIANDDIPPPPPRPNLYVNIGSWQEVP